MATCTYKVFISYKRKTGEDFALHLREGLEEEQIRAFLDIRDIPKKFKGTTEWWKFRDRAILHSEVFLLVKWSTKTGYLSRRENESNLAGAGENMSLRVSFQP
jgi:hypothetical protein